MASCSVDIEDKIWSTLEKVTGCIWRRLINSPTAESRNGLWGWIWGVGVYMVDLLMEERHRLESKHLSSSSISKEQMKAQKCHGSVFYALVQVQLLSIVAYPRHSVHTGRPLNHHKRVSNSSIATTALLSSCYVHACFSPLHPINIKPLDSRLFTPAQPRSWFHPRSPSSLSSPPTIPKP